METRDELPTLEVLKIKLIEESNRRQNSDNKVTDEQAFLAHNSYSSNNRNNNNSSPANCSRNSSNNNICNDNGNNNSNWHVKNKLFDKRCFNCGKRGHFAKNCRAKRRDDNINHKSFAVFALASAQTLPYDSWCVDSGATAHICRDRHMFKSLVQHTETISLAADNIVETSGIGEVEIYAETKLILKNVLYVPTMISNFISVSKATAAGYTVTFDESCVKIYDSKSQKNVLRAYKRNNLYVFTSQTNSCFLSSDNNIFRWHNRFGHLNFESLIQLAKNNSVEGLVLKNNMLNLNCNTCNKCKICAKPFPKSSENYSKNVLDLIHTDVCGPMNVPSIGGSKYFVTFIDDRSRKIFVYFMKSKSEVFEKFKVFKTYVECQTERKIKAIRSDNGSEYINSNFESYLTQCGIQRQLTVPYTPQQNGVSERANRTIVEMARSMLVHANLNETLWAEAVNTAVYIRNRSTTKILHNITPYEAWLGRKPSVKHLKTFGSPAIGLDKNQTRKFVSKGKEYIFVGYSRTAKAYRLYDKETGKVVEKRDVRFNEEALERPIEDIVEINEIEKANPGNETLNLENDINNEISESSTSDSDESEREISEDSNDMMTAEEEEEDTEMNRIGRGRPKLMRTGRRGRPRKELNKVSLLQQSTKINVPSNVAEALQSEDSHQWLKAMENEYKSLVNNKTWSLTSLPKGQKLITTKWVFNLKYDENGDIKRYKARLVAKGCSQIYGINYTETFSPVVRYATVRMVLALAVEYKLHLHQMDVSTAYLNSELEEDIYISQPENFVEKQYPDHVLKLNKAIYGLKQSGRLWNQKRIYRLCSEHGRQC